jgi:hypothetical protein
MVKRSGLLSPTGLSPSMARLIQRCSARSQIGNLSEAPYCFVTTSLNPVCTTDTAYHVHTVWAVPLSLATTNGIATCFLFLEVLRCFSSLGWPPRPMDSAGNYLGLPGRVAPFGDPRVSLPPAYRGLSQVCRVLHRLSVPRHPPHALTSLAETLKISSRRPDTKKSDSARHCSVVF